MEKETIEAAISVVRLIRIMKVAADVELRLPSRECPECKSETELMVVPEGLCGECWSRKAIAEWKVMPRRTSSLRARAKQRQRGERGKVRRVAA